MALRDILAKTYMDALEYAAANTLDPHSSAGAAIVTSEGKCLVLACNKLARGVSNEPWRWNRPQRYLYVEMAPRAAIFEAARRGERIAGQWIVMTVFPVADDARAIIETGIRGVAAPAPDLTDRLESDYYVSAQRMLFEAAIQVEYLTVPAP
jgi:dCMP deaminase